MNESKVWPTWARIALSIVVALLGFVFPLLFLVAGVILWSVISDLKNPVGLEPTLDEIRKGLTAADEDWMSHWLQYCESPAEEEFLKAMIDAFGFVPDNGVLRTSKHALDLQVTIRNYRVDFMMDSRLVIEVDGAAYHTSEEQIDRDRRRDELLVSLDYSVLRIPAKVVFRQPSEAIRRVRKALAEITSRPHPAPPKISEDRRPNILDSLEAVTRAMAERSRERAAILAAEAAKPKPEWINDPEFIRQLDERMRARRAMIDEEYGSDPFLLHLSSVIVSDDQIEEEEREQLQQEWGSNAVKAPNQP